MVVAEAERIWAVTIALMVIPITGIWCAVYALKYVRSARSDAALQPADKLVQVGAVGGLLLSFAAFVFTLLELLAN